MNKVKAEQAGVGLANIAVASMGQAFVMCNMAFRDIIDGAVRTSLDVMKRTAADSRDLEDFMEKLQKASDILARPQEHD